MEPSTLSQNLRFLRKRSKINQAQMIDYVGITGATWSNYENDVSKPNLETILIISKKFGVTINDLLEKDLENVHLNETEGEKKEGENVNLNVNPSVHLTPERIKDFPPDLIMDDVVRWRTEKTGNVYELDSKAAAGAPALLQNEDNLQTLPSLYLPGLGSGLHMRIEITGDSMDHTVKDGDKVVCTKLTEPASMLREGSVYVLFDREDGIVCKRVYKSGPEHWELESDNIDFKPYKRHLNDILAVFKVIEVHSRDLHNYSTDTRTEFARIWNRLDEIARKLPP